VEGDLAGGPDAEGIGSTPGGLSGRGELQQSIVVEHPSIGISQGGKQQGVCLDDCLRWGSHGINFTPVSLVRV
jgi:hypothetical protein